MNILSLSFNISRLTIRFLNENNQRELARYWVLIAVLNPIATSTAFKILRRSRLLRFPRRSRLPRLKTYWDTRLISRMLSLQSCSKWFKMSEIPPPVTRYLSKILVQRVSWTRCAAWQDILSIKTKRLGEMWYIS